MMKENIEWQLILIFRKLKCEKKQSRTGIYLGIFYKSKLTKKKEQNQRHPTRGVTKM